LVNREALSCAQEPSTESICNERASQFQVYYLPSRGVGFALLSSSVCHRPMTFQEQEVW